MYKSYPSKGQGGICLQDASMLCNPPAQHDLPKVTVICCAVLCCAVQVLLPALCSAICDPDAGPAVTDCAALLGCFCDFKLVLELLAPRVLDGSGDAKRQADVLLVLAAAIR